MLIPRLHLYVLLMKMQFVILKRIIPHEQVMRHFPLVFYTAHVLDSSLSILLLCHLWMYLCHPSSLLFLLYVFSLCSWGSVIFPRLMGSSAIQSDAKYDIIANNDSQEVFFFIVTDIVLQIAIELHSYQFDKCTFFFVSDKKKFPWDCSGIQDEQVVREY